eukprot:3928817-Alexandrium_andersonii.AAC.1
MGERGTSAGGIGASTWAPSALPAPPVHAGPGAGSAGAGPLASSPSLGGPAPPPARPEAAPNSSGGG